MFSDKSKTADAKWKIETFKQEKWNTVDLIIEFEALATKADTDELHTIFLLKKNARQNIVKIILGYPPIAMLETLKEWKVAITSVGQGYESMKGRHNYKMSTGTTYGGRRQPINIGRSNDNFKDGKPKCFNCNKYWHMARDCREKNEKQGNASNIIKKDTLQKTARGSKRWRTEKSKRTQTMKTTRKRRILVKISSRYSTRDLLCKFPK